MEGSWKHRARNRLCDRTVAAQKPKSTLLIRYILAPNIVSVVADDLRWTQMRVANVREMAMLESSMLRTRVIVCSFLLLPA